jgi:preprotein translocase subunit YajC
MEPLIVVAATFALLWLLFIRPQQRRVRGHQALVAALRPGDRIVLTAGIHGRIVDLGPEVMTVEVAPGVELRVARQAVLRRVEDLTGAAPWDRPAGEERPPDALPGSEPPPGAPGRTDDDPDEPPTS